MLETWYVKGLELLDVNYNISHQSDGYAYLSDGSIHVFQICKNPRLNEVRIKTKPAQSLQRRVMGEPWQDFQPNECHHGLLT